MCVCVCVCVCGSCVYTIAMLNTNNHQLHVNSMCITCVVRFAYHQPLCIKIVAYLLGLIFM